MNRAQRSNGPCAKGLSPTESTAVCQTRGRSAGDSVKMPGSEVARCRARSSDRACLKIRTGGSAGRTKGQPQQSAIYYYFCKPALGSLRDTGISDEISSGYSNNAIYLSSSLYIYIYIYTLMDEIINKHQLESANAFFVLFLQYLSPHLRRSARRGAGSANRRSMRATRD
jgi:hypothetical protein